MTLAAALLAAGAAVACAAPAVAADGGNASLVKPAAAGAPWSDAQVAALRAAVDAALAGAALRGAHVGVIALAATDGRVLYERNADDAFQPASTLKLVVGSAALDKLGTAFRFTTEAVIPDGVPLRNGLLDGPIRLRGTGDALLDDRALAELAPALRAAGIAGVRGVEYVDDAAQPRYPPGWSWDDLAWSYAAAVTPLGLNGHRLTLAVTPAARPGAPVQVAVEPWGTACAPGAPCHPDLGFAIEVRAITGAAGSPDTLGVERFWGKGADAVALTGSLAAGSATDRLEIAVPSPPRYAAAAAARVLLRAGFPPDAGSIAESAAGGGRVVWRHRSEPLPDLLADMWLPSDNLLAEELLRALGGFGAAPGSTEAGIAWEKSWLMTLGIDTEAVALSDGSGLSVYDRITPRAMAAVLKHDWGGPYRDLVLDALPVAGVRGTLRDSFRGSAAERRVFAKTGSLSHVRALCGFAANAAHGAVIFTLDVDDWVGDGAALDAVRARVLSAFVAA